MVLQVWNKLSWFRRNALGKRGSSRSLHHL